MRFRILIFIFLFSSNFLRAQLSETWRQYDSIPDLVSDESFSSSVIDQNGGFYVLADIREDIEVFHYDHALQLQWKQRMNLNGIGNDDAVNIVQAPSGLIYIAGTINNYSSVNDLYLGCLDTLGNIIWERSWNGTWNGNDNVRDMKVLPTGNLAIVGSTQTGSTKYSCIEQVWSSTGSLIASQEFASPNQVTSNINSFNKISVLSNNCFIACGQFRDTLTGDNGILTCFDPSGTAVLWSQQWDEAAFPNSENFTSVVSDTGGIFVGGWSGGQTYSHIRRYSNNGAFQWDYHEPSTPNGANVTDMTFDPDGNIGAAIRNANYNLTAIKVTRNGAPAWSYSYIPAPYNGSDFPAKIRSDASGNFYVAGKIEVASLNSDQALLKITSSGGFSWIRTRTGSQTDIVDNALNLIVDGNVVYTFGQILNTISDLDATISSYDLTGAVIQMITYTDPGGNLGFMKFTSDSAGNTYVCGKSGTQAVIVKRDFQGNLIWKEIYQDSVLNINITDIKTDAQGNVYFSANEHHVATLNDMLIVKYNMNGQLQWAISYNGPANLSDGAEFLFPDNYGNVYVTGGTGITTNSADAIVLKLNSSGTILWTHLFAGTSTVGNSGSGRITADGPSTLYYTYSPWNIGPNLDIALVKMDTSGNIAWQTVWDGGINYSDIGEFVGNFTDHSVMVIGQSSTPTYGYDIEILKFDTNGNFVWRRTLTNPVTNGGDEISSVVFKGDTIYFCGTEAYPPSYTYNGFYCGAMDSAGAILWQYLRYSYSSYANCIAVDKNTGIVGVTGYEHHSAGTPDIKTILFTPSGIPIDSARTGGPNNDDGEFISAHNNAFIIGGSVNTNLITGMSIMIKYCDGPVIQAASNIIICPGDTAHLTVSGGFNSYQWSPSSTLSNSSINNPNAWPVSTTTYSVVAINNFGCESMADQKVIVGYLPDMNVSYSSAPSCSGDTVAIQLSGVTTCLWQPANDLAGINLLSQSAWPPASQNYFVTGYNQWGCTDTASIFLNRIPAPLVTITSLLPDTMCITDPSVSLSALPTSGLFSGDGISNTTFNPSLAGEGYANFSYYYTDTLTGCSNTANASVYIDSCVFALIPEYESASWSVFPNPANNEIAITGGNLFSGTITLQLMDASSRIILAEKIAPTDNPIRLNVETIETGIYYVVIESSAGLSVQKIVIQH